jgi:PAS domain S-box-containing protein
MDEDELRSILSDAAAIAIVKDAAGVIVAVSRGFEKLAGIKAHQILLTDDTAWQKSSDGSAAPTAESAGVRQAIRHLSDNGSQHSFEGPGGERHYMALAKWPPLPHDQDTATSVLPDRCVLSKPVCSSS